MYPLFLALRYARSRAVTYLALFTVALSVASFVVVMGVLGGFRHKVEEIVQKTGSPLEVHCGSTNGIADAADLATEIETVPGVKGAAPYVQTIALLRSKYYSRTPAMVRGVDLSRELRCGALAEYLRADLDAKGQRRQAPTDRPLRKLFGTVKNWFGDAPRQASSEPPVSSPLVDFKVPADLRPEEINKEDLEPWEKAEPPGTPEAPPPHGTVPIWPGGKSEPKDKPGLPGPDAGRPLPPPPSADQRKVRPPKPEPIPRGAIVGAARAKKLELHRGAEILLAVQGQDEAPRVRSFIVVGFYETKTDWLDDLVFIDRRAAADLLGESSATGVAIWINDLHHMDEIAGQVQDIVGSRNYDSATGVRTWRQTRREELNMLEIQDMIMMIILLISFGLSGAFILAILWVLVSDKTRDIGTVRALGAGRLGVVATFVMQGLALGVVGAAIGLAGGLGVGEHVNELAAALDRALALLHIGPLFGGISAGLFGMTRLPVFYDPVHLISMVATTVAMSFLASLAPAWRAARLDPVEALRHE